MLTVIFGLEASGNSSTCSPFGKAYSVMPSAAVTFWTPVGRVCENAAAANATTIRKDTGIFNRRIKNLERCLGEIISSLFSCARYRMIAAHPVHSAAWRCRRRTKENVRQRRAVQPPVGTQEELPQMHGPAANVAAHQVGIVLLECGRAENVACQNMRPETGGEALDLRFDGIREVGRGTVGDVTISPGRMFSLGRAAGVEQARLGKQDERSAGMVRFPRRYFFERAPEMYRTGAAAGVRGPGDRGVERPIELEDA